MWNYFTIKWLCEILEIKLKGYKIGEVFSQNKDEIILGFYKPDKEDFFWVLNFQSSFPHMRFANTYSRAKRNSADLFSRIKDLNIIEVVMHEGERSFHFKLENESMLIFKMHGGRSNVIVKEKNTNYLFRSNIKKDLDFEVPKNKSYSFPIKAIQDLKELKQHFPIIDTISVAFLEKYNFFKSEKQKQEELINDLFNSLNRKNVFLSYSNEIWVLHQITFSEKSKSYSNLLDAINDHSSIESKRRYVFSHKSSLLKELKTNSERFEKSIRRMVNRLEALKYGNGWEQEANLIMANLHLFSDGKSEVQVLDFYNDKNKTIKIKKGFSAQKYAELLYKKHKNKTIEIKKLEYSISNITKEQRLIDSKIQSLEKVESHKDIKAWVSKEKSNNKVDQKDRETTFKEFKIKDYDIFVGKNAKNNDVLTTKFAKKDDLWMHAKDVSGSHLIIRKDKNVKVPSDVLEQAASIAAWYSKGKNDTLFPVIYTDRKYVRKGKGLAAGQVFVDKYDVIIVKPQLP